MTQIVIKPAIALVRADLFKPVSQTLIFLGSAAQLSGNPLVVSGTGHMEQSADRFNGISLFLVTFFDYYVNLALSYF